MSKPLVKFSNEKCRVYCCSKFENLKPLLLNFSVWFEDNGTAIHKDRNVIKVFDKDLLETLEADLVAKSFKVPHYPARIIYSYFRQSKAKRSFYNSLRLEQAGFSVPSPIAYIECIDKGLLKESYFISQKIDYDCTLHEVYRKQMFDWDVLLPLVVEQAFSMHQSGLMHRDFSHGNVLVKQVDDSFILSFVDLNRLYVGAVSFDQGLKSLVRLANDDVSLSLLAKYYANHAGRDEVEAFSILRQYLSRHRRQKKLKEKIKNILGVKRD